VSIPSNSLVFQLSLYKPWDYLTLGLLAILVSLYIMMNIYLYQKSKDKLKAVTSGGTGGVVGGFASIFGAASCPMCVASLFAFLGFGTVGFLVRYQWWIFGASVLFLLWLLSLTSKKVVGACKGCIKK